MSSEPEAQEREPSGPQMKIIQVAGEVQRKASGEVFCFCCASALFWDFYYDYSKILIIK